MLPKASVTHNLILCFFLKEIGIENDEIFSGPSIGTSHRTKWAVFVHPNLAVSYPHSKDPFF